MGKIEGSNSKTNWVRHLLAGLVLAIIAALGGYLWHGVRHAGELPREVAKAGKLPSDVEGVMKDYVFSDNSGDSSVEIKGRRIVRRGRLLLGLRTNMAKTCYFEGISGKMRSNNGVTEFSAEEAEWNMAASSPMVLHGNIKVRSEGRDVRGIRKCRIYLKCGVIELFTDHPIVLNFK